MNKQILHLHRGQSEVLRSKRRFKVVVAGRRWGKTQTAKTSIITAASIKEQIVWYVAPTYRMARSIMWRELLRSIPRNWIVKSNETSMTLFLRNGSIIECKGADKPDTLRGVALDHLVIDEAQDIRKETWYEVLRATLASTGGSAMIIGTPKGYNWFHAVYLLGQREDIYVDKQGRRRTNIWKSWQFTTEMSPYIAPSEIASARDDLDPRTFRQEFQASFETMSGRVYYGFDRKTHIKECAFNPKLPIWVGQDFNIDPMSSVIMQPQLDGSVWIIDEAILQGSNTEETADEIQRRYYRYKNQVTFYPDPAGNNRSHARGESDLDILREAGFKKIRYKRKHPPVADRVNAVNRMLQSAEGTIRLFVDPKCRKVIEALEQTVYKEGSRDVDKTKGVEHPADALGYCIHYEFPTRKIEILGVSL